MRALIARLGLQFFLQPGLGLMLRRKRRLGLFQLCRRRSRLVGIGPLGKFANVAALRVRFLGIAAVRVQALFFGHAARSWDYEAFDARGWATRWQGISGLMRSDVSGVSK